MTPSSAVTNASTRAHSAAGWLGFAASPTFALMSWMAANHAPSMGMCSPVSGNLPMDGMTAMYLLMSVFHLSPWLKLASGRPVTHS